MRGAVHALGVEGPVTSPTFTLAQRYDGGRAPVSHLDLYRLGGVDGEDASLLADEVAPDRIAFVEWPEVGDPGVGHVAARVRLEHAGGDRRRVTVAR